MFTLVRGKMNLLKYISLLCVSCILVHTSGHAQIRQKTMELGFFGGISNYIGDLAPDVAIQESRPAIGISLKKNVSPYFSYGAWMNLGSIAGNDKDFKYLAVRNLSFHSVVFEISPQMEFNFLPFAVGINKRKFTPYLFTGLSLFYFDPRATYQNKTYRLQPLSTEGQGLQSGAPAPYSLWQLAIPLGAGVKYNLNERWNIMFSCGYRATFTDYLDDVSNTYPDTKLLEQKKGSVAAALSDRSGEANDVYIGITGKQRGNPDRKDWYIFTGVTLSYIIGQGPCYQFRRPGFL